MVGRKGSIVAAAMDERDKQLELGVREYNTAIIGKHEATRDV